MERLLRESEIFSGFVDASASLARRITPDLKPREPHIVLWWIFAASVSISMAAQIAGDVAGPLTYIFAIGGSAGCGWLWLLSRSLFRSEKPIAPWNVVAVAAIVVIESYWELANATAASGEVRRIAANAASLICIGAVVLVFVEALAGYGASLPKQEKRFRLTFTFVFGAMVAVTFLWAMNANEMSVGARWAETTLIVCAAFAIVGARLAVEFRKRHPLAAQRTGKSALAPASRDRELATRILSALDDGQFYATPDLKVADLAERLKAPDYKVSQCITGVLGYRNFNHLINMRRIERAKEMLVDREHLDRPILSIAFECGFNSIGPFNRAFKDLVGATPREFRTSTN